MSSPEVERFEMSANDYYQMFDPTGNKNRRKQTKNDATYGIWADEMSDEEEQMVGLGNRGPAKKGGGGGSSSGISFVSGGFKGEEEKEGASAVEKVEESWIEKKKKFDVPMPRYVKSHQKDQDKEFGGWEKHTRGIGQRLLAMMGHKPGEGLGKKGQGITTPVEAFNRKNKKAAIGYDGAERSQRSLIDYPVKDVEAEEEKEFKKQMSQWRKTPVEGKNKKSKPKYVYKTAEEVLTSGAPRRKATGADSGPKVKVIDMTGKEQRVLSGYHAIGKGHDKPDEEEELIEEEVKVKAFDVPELMHNLTLLVELAEDDIVANHRKLRHGKDHIVNLEHEQERLGEVVAQENKQLDRLNTVMDIVVDCENRCKLDHPNPLTLETCVDVFKMLQQDYYEEYKIYDLPSLAIALVFPLMKTFFTGWLPLRDPDFGLATVMEWQLLLGADSSAMSLENHGREMDVYQRLIWDVWLPPVRATVLKWNVRETTPLTCLLETWTPALPTWVLGNILDQLVLPRLLTEVEGWNPLTDTTPIHCWLHPWLVLMGDKLEPLYAPIRHKIASALINWHPSDGSAKIILEPWFGVFKPGHMSAFLVKNILPKLELEIQGLIINPHQQLLDPWRWAMSWKDMLPIQSMVVMLDGCFFPKWHQVLAAWLLNQPNYQDITKWYLGWKAQFPDNLLGHPLVKDHFNKALETMNRAVSGNFVPGIKENIAYFTHAERRIMDSKTTPSNSATSSEKSTSSSGARVVTTFKELVEKRAEEEDQLYIPLSGRTQEGKQVYRFGKALIYYDVNVVFMQDKNGRWLPTSLKQLSEAAKG